jgi:hypothetical protein
MKFGIIDFVRHYLALLPIASALLIITIIGITRTMEKGLIQKRLLIALCGTLCVTLILTGWTQGEAHLLKRDYEHLFVAGKRFPADSDERAEMGRRIKARLNIEELDTEYLISVYKESKQAIATFKPRSPKEYADYAALQQQMPRLAESIHEYEDRYAHERAAAYYAGFMNEARNAQDVPFD